MPRPARISCQVLNRLTPRSRASIDTTMEERVMTPSLESPTMLTDVDLIVRLRALARDERRATVQLIAGLAEFERRQLYLAQGFSSLFTYCTDVLHFSEHAAYTRMEVARTALRFPLVLERLEDGSVTLTAVRRLGAVLTEANHREVLAAATHKKKGDIELSWQHCVPVPMLRLSCGSCRRRALPASRFNRQRRL